MRSRTHKSFAIHKGPSLSPTPFTTACHRGEWGERRKSLNWWKMDSGEVLCSGSSHRINGATLRSLFHSPEWSIIPPRLARRLINGADTAPPRCSGYIFSLFYHENNAFVHLWRALWFTVCVARKADWCAKPLFWRLSEAWFFFFFFKDISLHRLRSKLFFYSCQTFLAMKELINERIPSYKTRDICVC